MKKEGKITFELIRKNNVKEFSVPLSILQDRDLGLLGTREVVFLDLFLPRYDRTARICQ